MLLEPNEKMRAVTFTETIDDISPVFPDTFYEIGSDADIQRSSRTARKEVYTR